MSDIVFFTGRSTDKDPPPPVVYPPGTILIRAGGRDADIDKSLAVRHAVFVVEQNVPEERERDEHDDDALHLLAINTDTDELVGTARLVDKGDGVGKIGRVAVTKPYRRLGIGRALMEAALKAAGALGFKTLILDAQMTVVLFYVRLGFVAEGEPFLDAGISHRRMRRTL